MGDWGFVAAQHQALQAARLIKGGRGGRQTQRHSILPRQLAVPPDCYLLRRQPLLRTVTQRQTGWMPSPDKQKGTTSILSPSSFPW